MQDKQFTNFFLSIIGLLVLVSILIFVLARAFSSVHEEMDVAMIESIQERIKPVGLAYVGDEAPAVAAASKSSDAAEGDAAAAETAVVADAKTTYETVCAVCHLAGVANAPKLGDKAAWAPRLGDTNALYMAVINGKNAMPPRAGRPDLSDETLKAAVDYMLEAVQ